MKIDPVDSLDVFLNDTHVGSLIYVLQHDRSTFRLANGYINMDNPPTLSLSLKGSGGKFVRTVQSHMIKLPPFFSNLLPEGPLREYLAKKAGLKSTEREFHLLNVLAEDLPGAVILRPTEASSPDDVPHLVTSAPTHDGPLSFSLAGVQLKFSALQRAAGGLTIPATGVGGSWIVKLPSAIYQHIPENEFAMMTFARLVGIDVPEIELVSTEEIENLPLDIAKPLGKALAVRRFDRTENGERIHIEDFAQVFNVYC